MKKRSILISVLLTIVTCGIYGIYWMINLTNDINKIVGETEDASGAISALLILVTGGIYGWYWSYRSGSKIDKIKRNQNVNPGSNNITFVIFYVIGLAIVDLAIMQDAINKYGEDIVVDAVRID